LVNLLNYIFFCSILLENFAEQNEVGKIEKEYDQMFIKDNKAVMYDEESKKDMKDSLEFMKIEKLDMMFPKNFIQEIQDFSAPKLEFQTVNIFNLVIIFFLFI